MKRNLSRFIVIVFIFLAGCTSKVESQLSVKNLMFTGTDFIDTQTYEYVMSYVYTFDNLQIFTQGQGYSGFKVYRNIDGTYSSIISLDTICTNCGIFPAFTYNNNYYFIVDHLNNGTKTYELYVLSNESLLFVVELDKYIRDFEVDAAYLYFSEYNSEDDTLDIKKIDINNLSNINEESEIIIENVEVFPEMAVINGTLCYTDSNFKYKCPSIESENFMGLKKFGEYIILINHDKSIKVLKNNEIYLETKRGYLGYRFIEDTMEFIFENETIILD